MTAPRAVARRIAGRGRRDSGISAEPTRHRVLTVVGLSAGMILIAFTLSLGAAAALIIGLGAGVSTEAPAASAARGDAGLI